MARNSVVVPEAKEAMKSFKMQAASEVGVNLKDGYNGELTSRQAGSVGGTYKDVCDIMIEYGAVNACNMDGGSSSVMMYRDERGLFGDAGAVTMINNYSLLQSQPRRMPNFWLVRTDG